MSKLDIRFFNTSNFPQPLLDYVLLSLNEQDLKARAYISHYKYRTSIKGDDRIVFFEKAGLTKLSSSAKRLNQILYMMAASAKILFSPAKLHVLVTQPPLYVIISAWLCRLRGVPYIVHVMDHYPGLVGALGYLDMDGWLYEFLDKRMDRALQKADKVIHLGACMKAMLVDKGVPADRLHKVINVPTVKQELAEIDFLKSRGLDEKFTIIYAGNMGIAHEFDTLLDTARQLASTHSDIHFILLGKGHRRGEVEAFLEEHQPTNVTPLFGFLEQDDFTAVMQQTDLHVITLRDSFNGLLMPSKLYSTLALGQPVLFEGPAGCEIAAVIRAHDVGVHVPHGDGVGMREAILALYGDRERLAALGDNARQYFDEECQESTVVEGYVTFLKRQLS